MLCCFCLFFFFCFCFFFYARLEQLELDDDSCIGAGAGAALAQCARQPRLRRAHLRSLPTSILHLEAVVTAKVARAAARSP